LIWIVVLAHTLHVKILIKTTWWWWWDWSWLWVLNTGNSVHIWICLWSTFLTATVLGINLVTIARLHNWCHRYASRFPGIWCRALWAVNTLAPLVLNLIVWASYWSCWWKGWCISWRLNSNTGHSPCIWLHSPAALFTLTSILILNFVSTAECCSWVHAISIVFLVDTLSSGEVCCLAWCTIEALSLEQDLFVPDTSSSHAVLEQRSLFTSHTCRVWCFTYITFKFWKLWWGSCNAIIVGVIVFVAFTSVPWGFPAGWTFLALSFFSKHFSIPITSSIHAFFIILFWLACGLWKIWISTLWALFTQTLTKDFSGPVTNLEKALWIVDLLNALIKSIVWLEALITVLTISISLKNLSFPITLLSHTFSVICVSETLSFKEVWLLASWTGLTYTLLVKDVCIPIAYFIHADVKVRNIKTFVIVRVWLGTWWACLALISWHSQDLCWPVTVATYTLVIEGYFFAWESCAIWYFAEWTLFTLTVLEELSLLITRRVVPSWMNLLHTYWPVNNFSTFHTWWHVWFFTFTTCCTC